MAHLLTEEQKARYASFKTFVSSSVESVADEWDRQEEIPGSVIAKLSGSGYLGCVLPQQYGGTGWDVVTFGLLNEALGKGSSSLTSILTVQSMVSMALLKWGTEEQKRRWLTLLGRGEIIGAFALTEPRGGSDIRAIETEFTTTSNDNSFLLNGEKQWITCGQHAGVFLVFGKLRQQPLACLVPATAEGLKVRPIHGLMGFRAAGLATVTFDNVKVQPSDIVGKHGFGLSHVAVVGLHYGRISTACSALGLLRGCFEESIAYAAERKIAGKYIGEFGTIRSLIAKMGANLEAASLLCRSACLAENDRLPQAFESALLAKYFTSRAAVAAASDAVQIRGASGCHESARVSRYYRDAKIMEIIEGTTQIHEELLGKMLIARGGNASFIGAPN